MHKSGEIGKYFQSFKEKQSKKKNPDRSVDFCHEKPLSFPH
jgi:hypothetical protein